MTRREAEIFNCFADTVVSPEPLLPAVKDTDAAAFLSEWLGLAPKLNAAGLRTALVMLEIAPRAMGFKTGLRKLNRADRARFLQRIEKHKSPQIRQLVKALKGIAFLCYYGDDGLMKRLGYDADANVARARALRAAEGRP
jgi:hypothetical protein